MPPILLPIVHRFRPSTLLGTVTLLAGLGLMGPAAHAERADRDKPMNVEAGALRYDDLKQLSVFTGNVVLTKGTLIIRGERVEVRQDPDGWQYGTAFGVAGKRAFFRQKREGVDEWIEGEGERVEYDGKADTVKFIGQAVMRRFRGATLADETSGTQINYDNLSNVFSVAGGAGNVSPLNPNGRVRTMISPRESGTATVAVTPARAAAAGVTVTTTLRPSPQLGGSAR